MNESIIFKPDLSKLNSEENIDAELERVEDAVRKLHAYRDFLKSAQVFHGQLSPQKSSKVSASHSKPDISPHYSFRSNVLSALKSSSKPLSIHEIWDILRAAGVTSSKPRPTDQVSVNLANLKSMGEPIESVERGVWRYKR